MRLPWMVLTFALAGCSGGHTVRVVCADDGSDLVCGTRDRDTVYCPQP